MDRRPIILANLREAEEILRTRKNSNRKALDKVRAALRLAENEFAPLVKKEEDGHTVYTAHIDHSDKLSLNAGFGGIRR
jgi:hypothetical protein